MDRQKLIIGMIVMLILLMLLACRTRPHITTPGGVSVELPRTPQDAQRGGGR